MSTGWNAGEWSLGRCAEKRPFVCSHKKWNHKEINEKCRDRPRAAQICARGKGDTPLCSSLSAKQKRLCMKTCNACTARRMKIRNDNKSVCETLKRDNKPNIRRKQVGDDCLFYSEWSKTDKNGKLKDESKRYSPKTWDEAEAICNYYDDPDRHIGYLMSLDGNLKLNGNGCRARFYMNDSLLL